MKHENRWVKAPSLPSSAVSVWIAGAWRALSVVSSLGVRMSVVGEGPPGLVGEEDLVPEVEVFVLLHAPWWAPVHPNRMLWHY